MLHSQTRLQKHKRANQGRKCKRSAANASNAQKAKTTARPECCEAQVPLEWHEHNAWRKVWHTFGEEGWKVIPLLHLFHASVLLVFASSRCLQPHLPLLAAVTVCLDAAAAPASGRSVQLSSWLVTSECEALQEVILRFCFPSRYKCTIFSHLEDTSHLVIRGREVAHIAAGLHTLSKSSFSTGWGLTHLQCESDHFFS